jgi:hypothetical protein
MKALMVILLSVSLNAFSQEINFAWDKILGSSGENMGLTIQSDTSGFIYVGGKFDSVLTINGTVLTSAGLENGFVLKLDSLGNLIWAKQFSSRYNVEITSMNIDYFNNIIVIGDYKDRVHFDTTLVTNNKDTIYSSNMFIAKFNPTGVLIWAKNTGGVSYSGNSIITDHNNNILISGQSVDIKYFDTSSIVITLDSTLHTDPGGYQYWEYFHPTEAFLAKYDENGNKLWIIKSGGSPQKVIVDNTDNVIITGNFMGDTYFGSTLVHKIGFETTFLAKYTTDGNLSWIKTSGGSANWNSGYGLAIDGADNIYQSGQLLGNDVEFGGTVISSFAGVNAFLAKYDRNGTFRWVKDIGSPKSMADEHDNFNCGSSIKLNHKNEILLIGYFLDTLIFGSQTLKSNGAYDMMLLKCDSDGNIIKAGEYSDYGWQGGTALTIGKSDDIFLTGYTSLDKADSRYPVYIFIGRVSSAIPTWPLGVTDHKLTSFISYPDPVTKNLTIDFNTVMCEDKVIEIFDLKGKKVFEARTDKNKILLNVEDYPAGMYIVKVRTNASNYIGKFTKI